jgi:methionyl-tRNA formyltransferase
LSSLEIDSIIIYSHPFIIDEKVIALFSDRIIELHLSYLPWNRGADPTFWSFFDGTPKGVTLCRPRGGVDSVDVLVQRAVTFGAGDTLATTFGRLHLEVETLLRENWPALRTGAVAAQSRPVEGRVHRASDKDIFFSMLAQGWNTPVRAVEAMGRRFRGRSPGPTGWMGAADPAGTGR